MFVANITTAMTKASEKMFEILDKDGTLRGGSLKPNQVNEELNKTWPARELMKKNIRCSSIKKKLGTNVCTKRRGLLKDNYEHLLVDNEVTKS